MCVGSVMLLPNQLSSFSCVCAFQSTTAFGRMMIDLTKTTVEEQYTVANGYKADAKVSLSSATIIDARLIVM